MIRYFLYIQIIYIYNIIFMGDENNEKNNFFNFYDAFIFK